MYANTVVKPKTFEVDSNFTALEGKILKEDTNYVWRPDPGRALFYSALVPGLGQFYNRDYWSIITVYAIMSISMLHYSNMDAKFNQYRSIYINKKDGIPTNDNTLTETFTEERLNNLMDKWTSERDRAIFFMVLAYFINIGQAFVEAHLYDFDNRYFNFSFNMQWDEINTTPRFAVNLNLF